MIRSGPGGPGPEADGRGPAEGAAPARAGVQDLRRNDLAQMLAGAIHDLRTPLGAMSGWLEVIETDLGEVGGVVGKAIGGLRRAVDEQARMLQSFSNAFEVLQEPFDAQRRVGFVDRLLVAAERLDADAAGRLGGLAHLRGQSNARCIDGGNALDDGLLVFLKLLAAASVDEAANQITIDGEGDGVVVHLRSRPDCVDSLLAFCNGLNRSAVKRVNVPLPTLWSARTALLDSGLEPGARVGRRPAAGGRAEGAARGDAPAAPVPVDMVVWLRITDAPTTADAAHDPARVGDAAESTLLFGAERVGLPGAFDGGAGFVRREPPRRDGLAVVGALAAGALDDEAPRLGPHSMSLDAILGPTIDPLPLDAGLDVETRSTAIGRLTAGAGADETADGANRTILIVDDQKDIREMLALWLRCHQFQVVVAGSAREARQRLAESGDVQAALIDIRMPEEDGISLLRSIRERETERGERRMPALAITAQPSFETQSSALQAGFSGMLSKPLRLRQLIELVENLH